MPMTQRKTVPGSDTYEPWYREAYPALSDFGTWLRGDEINTLSSDDYHARSFRFLIARLSTYEDVADSFSHLLLYQIAASLPGCFPDLAYLPPEKDIRLFKQRNVPWLIGTKTKRGPDAFHLIGLSNAILQEIVNIPRVLSESGIPLKKSERLKRQDVPLVILGGANALHTTSLWSRDPLVDGVFIGVDTSRVRKLLESCIEGVKEGR